MEKVKSKSSSRTKSRKTWSTGSKANSDARRTPKSHRSTTKHDRVLAMLQLKGGATIAAMAHATGWQPHSVRSFLAVAVKRKLGLNLTSEKTKSGRVYRVAAAKPQSAGRSETAARG